MNGRYQNKGESARGGEPSLSIALAEAIDVDRDLDRQAQSKLSGKLQDAKTVALNRMGEDLEIVIAGKDLIARWVLKKDKFACAKGILSIQKSASIGGDNGGLVRNIVLDVHRSEGYLVLNSHGPGAGFILFVPIVGYESLWSRYALIPADVRNVNGIEQRHDER
ncbi:MAG TPA: hypothetical protein VMZ30_17370 [Pyrinomonadaceae bacterium]|nr:hypothetical protein [Pyrinomonadaceae bacterium]